VREQVREGVCKLCVFEARQEDFAREEKQSESSEERNTIYSDLFLFPVCIYPGISLALLISAHSVSLSP
jgi:hypothetical protein